MSKHTKGPWLVNGDQVEVSAEHNDGYRVCDVFGPDYKANALLIAAAPDLLDALKALSASIFVSDAPQVPDLSSAIRMTIDAIAKAEGRS